MAATIGTLETEVAKSRELPRPRPAAGPAAGRAARSTSAGAPDAGAEALPRERLGHGDCAGWGRLPRATSGRRSEPERRARAAPRPDRATTSWPRSTGSRRWSPGARCRAVVASRVTRIARTVRDTIPRLPNLGSGSPQAYSVMATATDYLPEAVGGYLRLPREWADSRPIDARQDLADGARRPARPARRHDGQDVDAVVPGRRRRAGGPRPVPAEKFGHASGGGALALAGHVIAPDRSAQEPACTPPRELDRHADEHTAPRQVTRSGTPWRRWCRAAGAGVAPTSRGPRALRSRRRWPSRRPVHPPTGPPRPAAAAPRTSSTPPSAVVAGARPRPRR